MNGFWEQSDISGTDGAATVYINHSVMNQIITRDKHFCDFTKNP